MTVGRRVMVVCIGIITLGYISGCDWMPGKPLEGERWISPAQLMNFSALYAQRCSGCHGADGRRGVARPLNDPLYLALVSEDTLRGVIARGVSGTSMPAFAQQAGGNLTDKQLEVLVEGIRSRWGEPKKFKNVVFPPYSLHDAIARGSGPGDPRRGAVAYQTYCAQCHGTDGGGSAKGGSVVDPAYLALVSEQALRTAVIVGRSDLGKPDWRANLPGRPMTPQEISDVVAWLASHREGGLVAQREAGKERR
jgi:cytochrome c oxidase cbb3-type subunit 3